MKRTRQESYQEVVCGCKVSTDQKIKAEFLSKAFCLAKEARADAVICGKPVTAVTDPRVFRTSHFTPLLSLCDKHISDLENHRFCPICGLVCAQRPYVRCHLKHRSHDYCLKGLKYERCPHCGDQLAESVTPRPISVSSSLSGMITFPNEHLAAKSLVSRKDEKSRFATKTLTIEDREIKILVISEGHPRLSKIQEKAEMGISSSTLLSDARSDLKEMNVSNLIVLAANSFEKPTLISRLMHCYQQLIKSGMSTDFLIYAGMICKFSKLLEDDKQMVDIILAIVENLNRPDNSQSVTSQSDFLDEIIFQVQSTRSIEKLIDGEIMSEVIRRLNFEGVRKLAKFTNWDAKSGNGKNLLHVSIETKSVEMVTLIYNLSNSALSALSDKYENNCFHLAAQQNSPEILQFFLNQKIGEAIENAKNAEGKCYKDYLPENDISAAFSFLTDTAKILWEENSKRWNRIVMADISLGRENHPIRVVNDVDNTSVGDFIYAPKSRPWKDRELDNSIESRQCCSCEGICAAVGKCACLQMSERRWYGEDGRLTGEVRLQVEPSQIPVIYECSDLCHCDASTCLNRVTGKGVQFLLEVFKTAGMGWGVRARELIPKGSFIAEYCGEVISNAEADKREDTYLFDLSILAGREYSFCVDANRIGNFARFFNHICEPNMIPIRVLRNHQDFRFPQLAFFAVRDIQPGEELGFDYGERFWEVKRNYFSCKCNSKNCKYGAVPKS